MTLLITDTLQEGMGETVDVLVVGKSSVPKETLYVQPQHVFTAGNYGTGSRAGGVSTLICAVVDDRRPNDEDETRCIRSLFRAVPIECLIEMFFSYSTFVRIGSGLSFSDYAWIRSKPWKVRDPKNPPEWLQTSKRSQEDKGDVYLEPEE